MEIPSPKRCLICGRELATGAGIDTHVKTHDVSYEWYRKWFLDVNGSCSAFDTSRGRVVLTISRELRPE